MTLTNASGTKAVNIRQNGTSFIAMYVDIHQGEQQVLASKIYGTMKGAEKWAKAKLA
jgi:hypothetical protein